LRGRLWRILSLPGHHLIRHRYRYIGTGT